jgi:queuosine precursor transporter
MKKNKRFTFKFYPATLNYLLFIVFLNTIFSYAPDLKIFGEPVSAADFLVGLIYVLRDFAQRETKHWVILAMIIGCLLSWALAEQQAALASVAAFAVGESLDWSIYTYTKKPLSQRILLSSFISSPADSAVNLYFLYQLNWVGFLIMTATKFLGAFALWFFWRMRRYSATSDEVPAST